MALVLITGGENEYRLQCESSLTYSEPGIPRDDGRVLPTACVCAVRHDFLKEKCGAKDIEVTCTSLNYFHFIQP